MGKRYSSKMLRILDNADVPEKFKSCSPSKISKRPERAFSIPAGPLFSCIGATDACVDCYAMAKRHEFENVQTPMAKNWLLLKKLESANDTNSAVKLLKDAIPHNAKLYRIHESGDFFSNWYVNVWNEVIKTRPDVNFWAYTRVFNLNYSKIVRQSNFNLWASIDKYNERKAKAFVKRYSNSAVKLAYGPFEHDTVIPENSVICPVTNDKLALDGACEKCNLCVVKNRITKNMVFLKH